MRKIVETDLGTTIFGAGTLDKEHCALAMRFAPVVVAADGGVNAAHNLGVQSVAVIGDLDSVSVTGTDPATTHRITEQDSTDFEKCVYSVEAPFLVAVGVGGPRLDHTLAAFNVLVRYKDRRIFLLAGDDLIFLAPPDLKLDLAEGTRVSLFPMTAARGQSTGLRWPIAGLALAPDGRIGTSNSAEGPVHLRFQSGAVLIILPWQCLPEVISAFGLSNSAH